MFSFLSPQILWILLAGVIFIFARRRWRRRRIVIVGSLQIWKSLDAKKLQKGSKKLVLREVLWQIIAYTLLVVAMAQPIWSSSSQKAHYTLLIDCSASMKTLQENASDATQTVFARAIHATKEILQKCRENDVVTIFTFPNRQMYRGSPRHIRKKLLLCKALDIAGDPTDFLHSLRKNSRQSPIFITDGAGHSRLTIANVETIAVGNTSTDNVGIVQCLSEAIANEKQRIFAVIKNFSRQPRWVSLQIAGKQVLRSKRVQIGAGSYATWTEELSSIDDIFLTVQIAANDNFPTDDIVYLARKPKLTVWQDNTTSMGPLLQAIPGIAEVKTPKLAQVGIFAQQPQIQDQFAHTILLNGITPAAVKQGVEVSNPRLSFTTDPLFDAVHPHLIGIERCLAISPPEGWQSIATVPEGMVIGYNRRFLYIGFALDATGWPNTPSFPIFWQNYFDHIAPFRDNFVTQKANRDYPDIGFVEQKSTAVSLLDEFESDNIGQQRTIAFTRKEDVANDSSSLQKEVLLLASLVILYLWYRERR